MIIYRGLSQDKSKIFYENVSDQTIPITIKIFEGYTEGFMYSSDLDLSPNVTYYTYTYPTWKNKKISIYHRETGDLLSPFYVDGDKSLLDYDKFGYIRNLLKIEKDITRQDAILQVIREHFYDRQYSDFCDIEEGDIVVDVGFNYGIFSLGSLYKGASKIYAFEPNKTI